MVIFLLTRQLHWRGKTLLSDKICEDLLCVDGPMQHSKTFKALNTRYIPWLSQIYVDRMDTKKERFGASTSSKFHPIDFSSIPKFPNFSFDPNEIYDYTPSFHGKRDSSISRITSFIKVLIKINVLHKDDWMVVFANTLGEDAFEWFF